MITRLSKTQHILAHSKSAMTQTSQQAHLAVLEASKVIIIRHANSTFNHRWSKIEKEIESGNALEEKFLEAVKDTTLLDCPLSELGVQQCAEASKLAAQLVNLKTVFVSPLRRALQTAYLLFKEHPNFLSLRFVVHPLLRENMHTVCDIPERFDIVKAEYLTKIPHIDFSLMHTEHSLEDTQVVMTSR